MVREGVTICPRCSGRLLYLDRVKRIQRTKRRETWYVYIRRLKCESCGSSHRELPDEIFPYKQYEAEVIRGVVEGLITSETLGYEDYPCEDTMVLWRAQNLQVVL